VKKPKRKTLSSPAKPRPAAPRNLTPELCNRLRLDLLAACKQVAETHGLTAEGGDLSDIDLRHGFGIQFRVGIPMPDGSLFSHDKALFDVLAPSFGLQPSDHGRIFRNGGEAFRITAINPNRPKYPVSAERLADGRGYKFSAENVAAYLKASDG
jgi:hypothetical protein